MEKALIAFVVLGFILFSLTSVFADGGFFSDYYDHMFTPDQKAVITWDGEKETMIIASSTKSEDLSNIAWIVPIQSSVKPEITASNISIFQDLINYFVEGRGGGKTFEVNSQTAGGVQVIESKEIDIYDITILKATDSQELLDWLNNNGYKVPEDTKPILDKYISKGNMYFIANKIDLKNLFLEEIDLVDSLQHKSEVEGTYFAEYGFGDAVMAIKNALDDTKYSWRTEEIGVGQLYYALARTYVNEEFNESLFLNNYKDKLYYLGEDFVNEFLDENKKFVEAGTYNVNSEKLGIQYWLFISDSWDIEHYNRLIGKEPGVYCLTKYYDFKKGTPAEYSLIHFESGVTERAVNIGICEEFSDSEKEDIRDNIKEFYDSYNKYGPLVKVKYEKVHAVLASSGIDENKTTAIIQKTWDLRQGIATPLKFEFQPEIPYYPLEISSINKGTTHIEVYVLTNEKVEDKNGITLIDKTKELSPELKEKLNNFIDVEDANYVTRLTYDGDLKDLIKDAEFIMKEPVEIGIKIFNLSNGRKAEIKIIPEIASERAIGRLGELNFTIQLKEVGKGDNAKPVYELTGNKQGKFLGIFKIMAKVQVQVDAETGDVKVIKPWWSFLVSGI